ncbi:unnamed protein product [Paramecium sonneborni]|uniref:Transmembrane protein n=1 Tax=Paramecium sonneborni TaxID=65129 RepID=A0A8S1NJM2_9CILI|nr:unnamed protein product [Paramecium sonneborni]
MELNTDPIVLQNSTTFSLSEFKPKYSQVIYSGSQVAIQKANEINQVNKDNTNSIDNNKQKQAPLIEKEIEYRKIFSRFAVTNVIFGIYQLIILIFKGILLLDNSKVIGLILLLVSYSLWGITFCIALKTFKDQKSSQLIIYQSNLFVIGIIDCYVQSLIFSMLENANLFSAFFYTIIWIATLVFLLILFFQCKKSKDIIIVIKYLKLEYLQHSSDTNV